MLETRGWQDRRTLSRRRALLYLQFAEQQGRRCCRDWNAARFSPAYPIEHLCGVSRNQYPVQRRERSAHDIHSTHKLVRTTLGVNAPDDDRKHLKRLREFASGQRESALHVFKVEAVRFAGLLDFFDQLLSQFRVLHGLGRFDDEVPLPSGGHVARLPSSMTIRLGKIRDR